ncbi:hypothetical protein HD554DRAFT_2037942 [Boletus coccyginus]|nr:hypothetical protein HD554DRAFT_2037942 [Boletus coccyginus]
MVENPPTTDMFFGDEDNPTMCYASDWFDNLTNVETADLTTLQQAFNTRWPPPKRPKFSEQVLKEENIGKWITPSDKRKTDYGQNIWANEVMKVAVMMGDTAGFLINCVVDSIPHLLKDHLTCRYNTWDEFKTDV